ncbi:hypothetical protein DYB38_004997 [Aphanomyces astaci]|uniref:DnaJ homologue subfamily C GRV2/DNAJC13 N-terminal domain-containing protein n=1 Tax=Aphanomyces astaci TaxID=112090 RepID=A0A397CG84_APHAT|nr:hypothetical protein DYB38_004997 [Aphanomyces astaci]
MSFTDRFLVVKVKWSGKIERILGFRPYMFATVHPKSGAITNEWSYDAITSVDISFEDKSEFTINMFGLKKKVSLKLRHRYRSEVLQALFRARAAFAIERRLKNAHILAKLTSFDGHVETFELHPDHDHTADDQPTVHCSLVDCVLQVGVDAVYQLGGTSGRFPYFDLTKLQSVNVATDDPTMLVLRSAGLSHLFHVASPNDVARAIMEAGLAVDVIVPVVRDKSAAALQSQHVHFTSLDADSVLVSYDVQFPDESSEEDQVVDMGSLVLTDTYLVERDHFRLTMFVQPLTSLYEIVRLEDTTDEFTVEFGNELRRTYYSLHRDAIIAHILDACASRGTLVRLHKMRTPAGRRVFLRRMLMTTASSTIPADMVWFQATWLHRLVGGGGDKHDTDSHGTTKTPSILSQLRQKKKPQQQSVDAMSHVEMVLDFNANVPLGGLSTKLKDNVAQATSLLLGEVPHMVLLRQSPKSNMDTVASYLQCLYRLVANPFSAKQALEHLARSEYMDAMAEILKRDDFSSIQSLFCFMSRLLRGPNGLRTRKTNAIVLGQLCQVLEALLTTADDGPTVDPLFNILVSHVSTHYAMLVRMLFQFAPPATVEAVVCILNHMVHTTVLSFANTHDTTVHQWNTSSTRVSSASRVFAMHPPERMIKQYHSFLMAHPHPGKDLRRQPHAAALRLRYRYRGRFLQQWMHLLQGDFDVAIECLGLDAVKYEGSKMSQKHGQVKSAIYVVPSGLVVTTFGGKMSLYDFGQLDDSVIGFTAEDPCGLIMSIHHRHRVVFSYERGEIFDRMQALAGQVGIQLDMGGLYQNHEIRTKKPTVGELGLTLMASFTLDRVDHGSSGSGPVKKRKRLALSSAGVVETDDSDVTNASLWAFDQVVHITRLQDHELRFELVVATGKSLWYDSMERDVVIATLLDACQHAQKQSDAVAHAGTGIGMFIMPTPLFMPLLPRCVLQTPAELDLLEILLAVHTTDDETARFWAITLAHALSEDTTGSPAGKAAEAANKKRIFMNSRLVAHLVAAVDASAQRPLSLLASATLFDSVLCTSRDSTHHGHFHDLVVAFGKIFPRLLGILHNHHPNRPPVVVVVGTFEACVLILKTVVEHSDVATRTAICDMALNSGLTLRHFYKAIYGHTQAQRFVHQFIVSIWTTGHGTSFAWLARVLPRGFLRILSHPSTKKMMMDGFGDGFSTHAAAAVDTSRGSLYSRQSMQFDDDEVEGVDEDAADDQTSRRLFRRLERYPAELDVHQNHRNYPSESCRDMHFLCHLLLHTFALPDLIWNPTTSKELKYALEEALLDHEDLITPQYMTSMGFAWNHWSFRVVYASLAKEIQVGSYYLRILMDNVHDGIVLVARAPDRGRKSSSFAHLELVCRSNLAGMVTHSIVDIAADPRRFFDQCFQRWLQELPFSSNQASMNPAIPQGGAGGGDDMDSASVVSQHDNAEIWCLQLMVATYKAYGIGSVEVLSLEKVAYVVRMLRGETRAPVIEELLSWLSTVASDTATALSLLTKPNMELFLDMSTLVHEHTPLQATMSAAATKRLRSMKSLKQLQQLELDQHNHQSFSYFNLFHKQDDLDDGETNIDTIDDTFQGEVYWYVLSVCRPLSSPRTPRYIMTDHDLHSISGPHPESILLAICTSKGADWSRILLSMYNERLPDEREWRPLLRVPRIRWRLFVQSPFHVNVCIYTISLVRSLVEAEIDRTSTGLQLLPVPAAANLYRCGAIWFMFASASRVSFYEHAVVLGLTHRRQVITHPTSTSAIDQTSALTGLLPEALVRMLDMDGARSFTDVFTFRKWDHRVLWTPAMRDHLYDMLQEHLAPFVCRLHQDSTAVYVTTSRRIDSN